MTEERPAEGPGALASARAFGADVMALLNTRLELVALEFKEETARRKRLVVLGFAVGLFLGCALLMGGFLVVAAFWDSHRLAAAAGVTVAYLAIGGAVLLRLRALERDSPPPFGASLEELRKDLEMFRGRDGTD